MTVDSRLALKEISVTLYDQMLKMLVAMGVGHISGVTGDAIHLLVECTHRQKDIGFARGTHGEADTLAPSPPVKLAGRFSAFAGTVAPGAIQLLNGFDDAANGSGTGACNYLAGTFRRERR